MISVSVAAEGSVSPLPADLVTSLVRATLIESGFPEATVQVIFTGDEYLRRLKQQFLDQDQYTDVLAFNLEDQNEPLEGEIYISQDRAWENSQTSREPYHRELMRLVIHGSLHLAGWEDHTPLMQAHMRAREEHFLKSTPHFDPP